MVFSGIQRCLYHRRVLKWREIDREGIDLAFGTAKQNAALVADSL
jgi:hypothetical protein